MKDGCVDECFSKKSTPMPKQSTPSKKMSVPLSTQTCFQEAKTQSSMLLPHTNVTKKPSNKALKASKQVEAVAITEVMATSVEMTREAVEARTVIGMTEANLKTDRTSLATVDVTRVGKIKTVKAGIPKAKNVDFHSPVINHVTDQGPSQPPKAPSHALDVVKVHTTKWIVGPEIRNATIVAKLATLRLFATRPRNLPQPEQVPPQTQSKAVWAMSWLPLKYF